MYRTITQLNDIMRLLATWFPQYFRRVLLPERSVENRQVYALRLRAGGGGERRGVLLVGGVHARELMNPDAIIELAVDLLVSHALGRDLVYGRRRWTANEVKIIVETLDVWLLPCSNPDGRLYVMSVDDVWRKNRRVNAGSDCRGVDLNRNLDLMWGVTQGQISCNPCSDVFCGPSAFSEPETRNVKHLLDTYRVNCFADVHSYSELVLYPWGHAPTQTVDPTKRFTTLPTGTCAPIAQPGYQEYMTPRDQLRFQTVAQRIVDAIAAVRGRVYTAQTGLALYPTTGTHSDYVYSRHIADPNLRKTYGYTFETGPWVGNVADSFHPADPTPIKNDTKSGMLALMQQCVCAIELIGGPLLQRNAEVSALRRVRDELLATTDAGRAWIALFERVQVPVIAMILRNQKLLEEARSLLDLAARLVMEEQSAPEAVDIERVLLFLRRLAKASREEAVRTDLEVMAAEVNRLGRLTAAAAIEQLMHRGPADR